MQGRHLHEPIETMTESIGFDEQTRSLYSLDAFAARESESVLKRLFDYWQALPRSQGGLPLSETCNPKSDLEAEFAEQICALDTSSENPLNYVVRDHAASPLPGHGHALVGRPLCDRPELDMDTTACAVEFLYCKRERTPMYHEIEQMIGGLKRHYTRIMVPVEDSAGAVCLIYFAMREIQPAKRVTFPVVGEH